MSTIVQQVTDEYRDIGSTQIITFTPDMIKSSLLSGIATTPRKEAVKKPKAVKKPDPVDEAPNWYILGQSIILDKIENLQNSQAHYENRLNILDVQVQRNNQVQYHTKSQQTTSTSSFSFEDDFAPTTFLCNVSASSKLPADYYADNQRRNSAIFQTIKTSR